MAALDNATYATLNLHNAQNVLSHPITRHESQADEEECVDSVHVEFVQVGQDGYDRVQSGFN